MSQSDRIEGQKRKQHNKYLTNKMNNSIQRKKNDEFLFYLTEDFHSILLDIIKKALRKTLDGKHVSSKSRVKYGH